MHLGLGRTFYQRDDVRVTDQDLITRDGCYRMYDLCDLRTMRGPRDPLTLGAAAFAGVLLFAVALSWSYFDDPVAWVGVAVVALIPLGAALLVLRLRRRPYQLWADYEGARIMLLTCADRQVYGQISRALLRAREACGARLDPGITPTRPLPSG